MEHKAIIGTAAVILRERQEQYGDMTDVVRRACDIYRLITGKSMSEYEANIFMHSLKLARIRTSPNKPDHYVDGINYLAFAGEFATNEEPHERTVEESIGDMFRDFKPEDTGQ